jgi:signal transduction histidine kinase
VAVEETYLDVAARVAAATAHEFNNHLAAVALQAELALAGVGDDPKMRRRLEGILTSCEAARETTRALLAFGSRRPLQPRRVDVREALERLAATGTRVALPERNAFVDVDPHALSEALSELIARAGPDPFTVAARVDGDMVEIVLPYADAADEEARRAFEPYSAEHEERPLALAVVWGFVRQSGGMIDVEGTGRGAVVTIRLPRTAG